MVKRSSLAQSLLFLPFLIAAFAPEAMGQKKKQVPQDAAEDVIRVETELVQTDVTVVDKQNRLVSGLNPEQFELRVDTKVQPLVFFEQVTTGSAEEGKQLAATRKANKNSGANRETASGVETKETKETKLVTLRGRLFFFFVDDVHLANEGLTRTRSLLLDFVQNKMAANDRVAIVSTSGRIGFLQQLTDNKTVLREAIARLNYIKSPSDVSSSYKVPISEVDANLIANHSDWRLFAYLVEATKNEYQMGGSGITNMVINRIRQINAISRAVELQTLSRLESLVASTAPLAGRKLIFFISDGFIVDNKKSRAPDVLRRIVNEAARVGAVVYTFNTRSTFSDAGVDATRNDYPDFTPRQGGRTLSEIKAPQEPLETLADETGGRAFLNPNALEEGILKAISETSGYYLLAWRPDTEKQRAGKSRIEVVVKGHPELRVRMRRHFFQPGSSLKPVETLASTAEDELRQALASLYPRREVPTSISVGYVRSIEKGMVMNVAMQIDATMLSFDGSAGQKDAAAVDVLGVALDDRGSFSSFKQKLSIDHAAVFSRTEHSVQWNQSLPLPPGIYQVRVAVRDRQSGRTGSAAQWVEIPRLTEADFSLSSIFIGERNAENAGATQSVPVKVDRNFARGSRLRYQASIYDVPRLRDSSAVSLQVEILRSGSQAVVVMPAKELTSASAKDSTGIPVTGEIELGQLTPGWYVLQITATDKSTNKSILQQANFVVY